MRYSHFGKITSSSWSINLISINLLDRRGRRVRYTPGMRLFHAAVLTGALNETSLDLVFSEARRRFPGRPAKDFIIAFDLTGGENGPGSRGILAL